MATEKSKMLSGKLYDPADPQLMGERRRARLLLKALNDSGDDQQQERAAILQQLIPTAGADVWIEPPFYCDYGTNITLGDKVLFNFDCVVLDVAAVRIGSRVLCGPAVQIYAASHPLSAQQRQRGLESGSPVTIGDDAWIGGGAVICPGIDIGARTTIGAGSVVTSDIPADVLAAGNPCRVLRTLEH